jgi:hypothetical protein
LPDCSCVEDFSFQMAVVCKKVWPRTHILHILLWTYICWSVYEYSTLKSFRLNGCSLLRSLKFIMNW